MKKLRPKLPLIAIFFMILTHISAQTVVVKGKVSSIKKNTRRLILLLLILAVQVSFAQQKTISGTVTEASLGGIPGVNILLKGTKKGTQTDLDGKYSIKVKKGDVLIFSSLGMKTVEKTVSNANTINVAMVEDEKMLDEVVVVGYGSQKKVNLTGSIATVKSSEIIKSHTASLSSGLAGTLAGVTTVQKSGEPGSDTSSFRIRGISSVNDGGPLILVDGIVRSMNDINPNDIASVSVLKDAAAAAIYGMRAGNGVVLIITKRGKRGKNEFKISTSTSIQQIPTYPHFLDSYNYATLLNEANANDGVAPAYTDKDLQLFKNGSSPDTHPNTDWFKESLRSFSQMRSLNLSGSGGSKNGSVNYFSSLGYLFQDALYDGNNFKRYNFRTNLDIKVSDGVTLTTDFAGDMEDRERPNLGTSTLFSHLYRNPPTKVNRYSNGSYSSLSQIPMIHTGGFYKSRGIKLQSKIALRIDFGFLQGLNLLTRVAFDYHGDRSKNFSVPPSYTTFDAKTKKFTKSTPETRKKKASVNEKYSNSFQLVTEAILSYNKKLGHHRFGAKFVFSRTDYDGYNASAGISNLIGVTTPFFIAGDPETRSISNGKTESARLGYAGRVTYSYKDRYLLEFNGRYDGSYKFSPGHRFGFFPSVSFAWRISKENFLKNSKTISNLKIRGSYGELGSDSGIKSFRYLQFFKFSSAFIDNKKVVQSIYSNGLADKNTTWEKAKSYNIGLELGLWNNSLSVEADVFYKRTSDILSSKHLQVPATLGASLPYENFGIVDNKGFEVVVKHQKTINNDFNYFVNLNFSFARNKIIDLAEAKGVNPLRRKTGRPIGTRIGLLTDGLFLTQKEIDDLNAKLPKGMTYQEGGASPGDVKYVDANGDGKVNSDDRTVIGKSITPEITYGLNLGINYKQFDLSALFQGAANFDIYLNDEAAWAFFNGGKVFEKHLDRARIGADGNVINAGASYPRLTLKNRKRNERTSSYWVKSGNYLRLKNIEIGYTLPRAILSKIGMSSIRLYANGRNLITWSNLGYIDPENTNSRGRYYPQQRVYSLGINLQF